MDNNNNNNDEALVAEEEMDDEDEEMALFQLAEGLQEEAAEEVRFGQVGAVEVQEEEADNDNADNDNDNEEAHVTAAPPKGPFDPGRMQLSQQERVWALAVKAAIEGDPEVDNLNDFWYAQLALIEQDDVEEALSRAYQLQGLREEYGIVDTFEYGRRVIHESIQLFPGYYLCYTFHHREGNYVLVVDLTKLPMKTFRTNRSAINTKVCEIYFMSQLMSPDFESIRRGIICLAECEGFHLQHDIGVGIWRKIWDLVVPYPLKVQKIKHFHTGVFANLMVSMVRQFLPQSIRSTIEVGCLCEAGRLDRLYLLPDAQTANQRTLCRLEDSLKRRYQNETTFRL